MQAAIQQAVFAKEAGDYSNGAVLVIGDEIIAAWGSRVKQDESPIAHSDVLAILDASQKLKSRHLINAVLYSTQEPCPMCSSAAILARIKGIVYGANNADMMEFAEKNPDSANRPRIIDVSCEEVIQKGHADIEIVKDFMRRECLELFIEPPTLHAVPVDESTGKI